MHLKKLISYLLVLNIVIVVYPGMQSVHAGDKLQSYKVQLEKIPAIRVLDAKIEAVRQATVASQVRGRIIELPYDVDDYVKKGDVLVRFRDRDQRAAVKSAQAQFDEASSSYKRTQEIYARKLVAKSVLDKADARLKSAKAALDQAREALENTVIRAPYSGIVVKRHVEVGELANIGQKLMTGLSLEILRASVELPQSLIHQVRQYKQATISLGSQRNTEVKVTSMSISPYADPMSHTFATRLHLPRGDYKVYPGMYTKASFVIGEDTSFVIPQAAVTQRGEVTAVYVQNTKGLISFRQVRPGHKLTDNRIEILAGLSEGEQVLLDPVKAASLIKQQNNKETH